MLSSRHAADRGAHDGRLRPPAHASAGLPPGRGGQRRARARHRAGVGHVRDLGVVRADGANLRSFPARGVDAATLSGVVDLGVASGSLRICTDALAVGSDARRSSAGTSATGSSLARRRHARHVARRGHLLATARLRRHRASARAVAARHRPLDDAVFVRPSRGATRRSSRPPCDSSRAQPDRRGGDPPQYRTS